MIAFNSTGVNLSRQLLPAFHAISFCARFVAAILAFTSGDRNLFAADTLAL